MGSLQFHQILNETPQTSTLMTLKPFSCNLTTTLYIRSIITKCLCTSSSPKVFSGKVKAVSRVSADDLKGKWLNSLTCPPVVPETENFVLQNDGNCGNSEVNVDSKWVIGIDPDNSGAIAVLKPDDFGSSAEVYDSPNVKVLVGNRIRRRMDTNAMVQLLRSLNIPIGTTAYIEQSLPFPGDGKQGWWSGGFNYGLWIGVLVASEVSVIPVPSVRWKQEFKLSGNGKTKDDSRTLACTLFPTLSSSLKRKKDHGRAEALLIAAYGKGMKLNSDSSSISNSLMPVNIDDSTWLINN